ncbi:hypothetical protein PCS_01918 [Desulfocurvibacter africanus PCS]|uniref:EF-hand domain-containing protein n=1 Tax=Desulfocurvibacter africanus PCS TaxID=1262666 RepID=M5PTP7_DESAF|nr:hypothetical protein [Desulfocurvibacter africanus]EMG37405.1 hypothetical protein PCS_01918 [Desulfocurvibacter africanus PCS]
MRITRNRRRHDAFLAVTLALFGIAALVAAGCAAMRSDSGPKEVYRAEIKPLNQDQSRSNVGGTALFEVYESELVVTVSLTGAPPNMTHMQHLHGFTIDEDAECPDQSADRNNDGAIDMLELEATMGKSLVPLHDQPAHLAIQGVYPRADANGSLSYSQRIPLGQLKNALKAKHGLTEFDLEDMAITIHGVDAATPLPPSVKSLPGVRPQDSLPIACGELEEVD